MRRFLKYLFLFVGLILFVISTSALEAKVAKKSKAKKHPPVEAEMITEDPLVCLSCHQNQAKEWEGSAHGLNQVRCFICHGDLEKRFEPKPSPSNCVMCHAEKLEDLKKAKIKTCFQCHNGHTLVVKPAVKNIHTK